MKSGVNPSIFSNRFDLNAARGLNDAFYGGWDSGEHRIAVNNPSSEEKTQLHGVHIMANLYSRVPEAPYSPRKAAVPLKFHGSWSIGN